MNTCDREMKSEVIGIIIGVATMALMWLFVAALSHENEMSYARKHVCYPIERTEVSDEHR